MYALVMVVVLGLISMDGPEWTAHWTTEELETHRALPPKDPIKPAEKIEQKPQPSPQKFPVNINTATAEELDVLPGVGPAMAQRIIAYRTKKKFKKIRDIQRVRGIGEATFKRLESKITIEDKPSDGS